MDGATRCGRRTDRDRKQGDQADRGRIMTDSHPTSTTIVVSASQPMVAVLGPRDELLRVVETAFPSTDISVRGNEITVAGEPGEVALVERLYDELITVLRTGQGVTADAVQRMVSMLRTETGRAAGRGADAQHPVQPRPHDPAEDAEPEALRRRDRPQHHHLRHRPGRHRQDLPRGRQGRAGAAGQAGHPDHPDPPAVEAGERLGFLPGTLFEKIDPYLRPLYDALHDMIDPESIPRLMTAGPSRSRPLAYMRGRSLNDAFIILDEAQNTSPEQMKMFLTRLGFGSKMVVTGDVTQVDLPGGTSSGLRVVQEILDRTQDVEFCRLTAQDVVRHRLVSDIVEAYGRWDADQEEQSGRSSGPRSGSGGSGRRRR
jgi:phosphate starvation-inducible PhoH-like protein